MENVSRDEQRHIGFGVKVLTELCAESDEIKAAIRELLLEVMPYSLAVFVPPTGFDREYTRAYGFEMEDIYAFGLKSLKTKWRAIGYPMEEMPGVLPIDHTVSEEEIAKRQIALLESHVMGEPHPDPDSSPEVQRYYFDVIANSADTAAVNGKPFTIQWDFDDADPWHVVVANGSTRAEPGVAAGKADLTWKASWGDWISISKGALSPANAMLHRRLRFRGSPRKLRRFMEIFPRRRSKPLA
jgi:putative sterol carrier protein